VGMSSSSDVGFSGSNPLALFVTGPKVELLRLRPAFDAFSSFELALGARAFGTAVFDFGFVARFPGAFSRGVNDVPGWRLIAAQPNPLPSLQQSGQSFAADGGSKRQYSAESCIWSMSQPRYRSSMVLYAWSCFYCVQCGRW
jgi:hypothetical protein